MTGEEATAAAIDALVASGLPYMLVGSFSSNLYGIPRSTKDADFVVALEDRSIMEVARRLPPSINVDPQMAFETVTMTRKYEAMILDSPFKIEFFLLSDDPHDRSRFERRRIEPFLGRQVHVPAPEDVIIQKLRWHGLVRRSKDLDDARDVLAVQGDTLDFAYIHRWCDAHGTRVLLDDLLASIPPID
jgi:hypothetical protein